MATATYHIGDVHEVLATLPDDSVDLVLTSPPFLALRSYLPDDHPDKTKEIGSEPTPAEFIDALLDVVEDCDRVLAPHGSIAFELGDTYSGSGGSGGDYNADGLRDGQQKWNGSAAKRRRLSGEDNNRPSRSGRDDGWPLAKSLCLIPESFRWALVYGFNPFNGRTTPQWRARNVVRWCRPNPPVGALGDKYRPATSEMVIACKSDRRWFDLHAVRTPLTEPDRTHARATLNRGAPRNHTEHDTEQKHVQNPSGAPPLDWWNIPTQPYKGKRTTTRREPCGPLDGGQRTTSPDCPVHAGLPGQLPKALRDERGENPANRTGHTDGRPGQAQLDDSAPTLPLHEQANGPPSSDSPAPEYSPAATPHNTPSRKTGPVPATSLPGTSSGETLARTERRSESPSSSARHPGKPASNTDEVCPSVDAPGTQPRTPGTPNPSAACTCTFTRLITESTSHYATWPEQLCVRPILSMCPQRVCTTCGEPSRRITEPTDAYAQELDAKRGRKLGPPNGRVNGVPGSHAITPEKQTVGWSDCGHGTWRQGVVLDPFAGSGTTLKIATGHGRDAIGIDLDERNADLAVDRVGPMFLTIEHLEAVR